MGFGGILGQGISTPVSIPDGGTGATTALGARTNLEVGKTVFGTATFTKAGWTQQGSVYKQTQTIQGLAETMRYQPIIYLLTQQQRQMKRPRSLCLQTMVRQVITR